MDCCVIFGGAGYIGTKLAEYLLESHRFEEIVLADIKPSPLEGKKGIAYYRCDVRTEINEIPDTCKPGWIFNFAAIHREPGHEPHEYYETNLKGAENVCRYAEKTGCNLIYFTASISTYGPTSGPTDEYALTKPTTPYGISKLTAEYIHKLWQKGGTGRRLVICRPGVIYGPGDPGNILRMIKAIQKGYFIYPGASGIYKSYGYIYGLLESIVFAMNLPDPVFTYNYVEYPTEKLEDLIAIIKQKLDSKAPVLRIPIGLLLPLSKMIALINGGKGAIHPVRVRKAATQTHIIPKVLQERGFLFQYDFARSLDHWKNISKNDFIK